MAIVQEQLASECSSLNKKYKYLHNKFEKLKNKIHMAEDLLTDLINPDLVQFFLTFL
jgi:ABC-type phosphate transport system auxiliary subunit